MTTVTLCLDLDTPAGRAAMRSFLDSLEQRPQRNGAAAETDKVRLPAAMVCAAPSVKHVATFPPVFVSSSDVRTLYEGGGVEDYEPAPVAAAPVAAAPDWPVLIGRVLGGEDAKAVAAEAGVKAQALRLRVTRARHPGMGKSDPSGPEPAHAATGADEQSAWAPPAEPEPAVGGDAMQPEPEPGTEADTPGEDGWSPREDVTILRRYGQGENSYRIAQQLKGRKAADVVNRYRVLVPRPGILEQRRALARAETALAATA